MKTQTYDFIVVGAGSAGCVLAARLTEDPSIRVLLLEAGPPDRHPAIRIPAAFSKLFQSKVDWAFRTEPQAGLDGRQIFTPRGKTLGGSSSINAMIFHRGYRQDYDAWRHLGNSGWGADEVLPYFLRSEGNLSRTGEMHRQDGPQLADEPCDIHPMTHAFVEAARQRGLETCPDLNLLDGAEGVAIPQVFQKRGRRWSAADGYLRPARKRKNLVIATGALAERLLFDGDCAVGVRYVRSSKRHEARVGREVLLSAGAIGSPHLLLRSGIGPKSELEEVGVEVRQHLPGVGRNLKDHLCVLVNFLCKQPISLLGCDSLGGLLRYVVRRKGGLTSNVAEAVAFVRSRAGLDAPDMELLFAPVLFLGEGLEDPTEHGLSLAAVNLQPEATGTVRLRSADPTAAPRIDPGYLDNEHDRETLRLGLRKILEIADAPALTPHRAARLNPAPSRDMCRDEIADAYVREGSQTLFHPVGTCRMGQDDDAVVDAELRVRGLEGLRVIDASIMPTIPRGHTHAPTLMIAEKASEFLLR